ncbi:hypothetical protein D3C71_2043370 [compost metagenome]
MNGTSSLPSLGIAPSGIWIQLTGDSGIADDLGLHISLAILAIGLSITIVYGHLFAKPQRSFSGFARDLY